MPNLALTIVGDVSSLVAATQQGRGAIVGFVRDVQGAMRSTQDLGKSSGIKGAIDEQRKQLNLMKGNYDQLTAAAIDYRRRGAPEELVQQYIRLRREVMAVEQAKTAAAARAKADKDAELALMQRNSQYEASQTRLSEQRAAAIRRNINAASGAGGGGGGGMNSRFFPMAMNSLAVGFQDAVSVYQVNGSMLSAISAAGNNVIFLLTMLNPMAGALGAIAIGISQLGIAWLKSGDEAENAAAKEEAAQKRVAETLREKIELQQKLRDSSVKEIDDEVKTRRNTLDARKEEARAQVGSDDETFGKALDEVRKAKTLSNVANAAQKAIDPVARSKQILKDTLANEEAQQRVDLAVAKGMDKGVAWHGELKKAGVGYQELYNWAKRTSELSIAESNAEIKKVNDRKAREAKEEAARKTLAENTKRDNEAKALKEKTENPWETFYREAGNIQSLRGEGRIDDMTARRAMTEAAKRRNQDLIKDIPDQSPAAKLLVRGSAEAARVQQQGRSDQKMLQVQQQALATQKQIAANTERMATNPLAKPIKTVGERKST